MLCVIRALHVWECHGAGLPTSTASWIYYKVCFYYVSSDTIIQTSGRRREANIRKDCVCRLVAGRTLKSIPHPCANELLSVASSEKKELPADKIIFV